MDHLALDGAVKLSEKAGLFRALLSLRGRDLYNLTTRLLLRRLWLWLFFFLSLWWTLRASQQAIDLLFTEQGDDLALLRAWGARGRLGEDG